MKSCTTNTSARINLIIHLALLRTSRSMYAVAAGHYNLKAVSLLVLRISKLLKNTLYLKTPHIDNYTGFPAISLMQIFQPRIRLNYNVWFNDFGVIQRAFSKATNTLCQGGFSVWYIVQQAVFIARIAHQNANFFNASAKFKLKLKFLWEINKWWWGFWCLSAVAPTRTL